MRGWTHRSCGSGGGGVVARRRRPRLEVLVAGEGLGDQARADGLSVSAAPRVDQAALRLLAEDRLADPDSASGYSTEQSSTVSEQQPQVRTQMRT